jgi:acylphosphatase
LYGHDVRGPTPAALAGGEVVEERVECGWIVRGRVQGVGFRWWTARQARDLRVDGTVENLADGSVRVMARGSQGALERLGSALARGPEGARVEEVDDVPCALDVEHRGFAIVR